MIRVKQVYEKPEAADGCRVLVDRLWPRRLARSSAHLDHWMKDVVPSNGLRKWFAHDPVKWSEFQKRYRAELAKSAEQLAALKRLARECGTLTLLYGARDEAHNQAVVLAAVLKGRSSA